jgi:hypothetical protein
MSLPSETQPTVLDLTEPDDRPEVVDLRSHLRQIASDLVKLSHLSADDEDSDLMYRCAEAGHAVQRALMALGGHGSLVGR